MFYEVLMEKRSSAKVVRGMRELARGGSLSRAQTQALRKKGYSPNMSSRDALKKLDEIGDTYFDTRIKRNRQLHPGNRFNQRSAAAGNRLDLKLDSMRRKPIDTYDYDQKEYMMNLLKRRKQKAQGWDYDLKDTDVSAGRRPYLREARKKIFLD
jgi:hypothetical protein